VIEKEITNAKLNFFTKISHELRTPLTLILTPAIELKNNENLSEKGKIYSQLIEQNAQRLLKTVNQLLDFRKVQNHKMPLLIQNTDIVRIIRKACLNFTEIAREQNIQFSVTIPNETINALVDEEKIDSVIYNLLSNAFKFTPDGGKITVTLEKNTPASIGIVISDTGCGITKDQEQNIFKIYSSNNHNTHNIPGTGIGLSLSKELMKIQNGDLFYRQGQGRGATFVILINTKQFRDKTIKPADNHSPHELKTRNNDSPAINIKQKKEQAKILIVEDNNDLRKFLCLQLKNNFIVHDAGNGEIGLKYAQKIQPDIIISDLMMPVIDGIQLLNNLKNNFETSHIPVILLTAKSSVDSKIEGLKYGADAYITKPFNTVQLEAQIDNLLNQRAILRKKFSEETSPLKTIKKDINITDNDANFITDVAKIIDKNLSNIKFRTTDIYKETGMGRSKFYDKIKGLTGLAPVDFIKEYRLNKAMQLIKTGKFNISEISIMTGFSDAGYFSKCFKDHFGKPPSQF
jgi:DNA-binding response OmpR family regulator